MTRFEYYSKGFFIHNNLYITQIYSQKLLILSTFLFLYHLFTKGIFVINFTASLASGMLFFLCLHGYRQKVDSYIHHLFFIILLYCFLPYWTPLFVYIISSILLVLCLEVLTINNYVCIHPVILIVFLFYIYCLYTEQIYMWAQPHYILQHQLYNFSMGSDEIYSNSISDILGFCFQTPAQLGGLLIFITYFFSKKFDQDHLAKYAFIYLFIFYFILKLMTEFLKTGNLEDSLVVYAYRVIVSIIHSNAIFTIIFILLEPTSSGKTYNITRKLVFVYTVLLSIFLNFNFPLFGNILTLLIVYLVTVLLEYLCLEYEYDEIVWRN